MSPGWCAFALALPVLQAKNDMMANIARFGMGFANVFSLPLMFSILIANCFVRPFVVVVVVVGVVVVVVVGFQ